MQALFRLVLEGLAMFAGSWAAGSIPLFVQMSASKFNLIALFGAGLLIGASLGVILTEGIELMGKALNALQESPTKKAHETLNTSDMLNDAIGWSLIAGFSLMFLIDNAFPHHAHPDDNYQHEHAHNHGNSSNNNNDSGACLAELQIPPTTDALGVTRASYTDTISLATVDDSRRNEAIDSVSFTNSRHGGGVGDDEIEIARPIDARMASEQGTTYWAHTQPRWRRILGKIAAAVAPHTLPSTLIGILVHSCADGLALGAAVAASAASAAKGGGEHTTMEIVVFLALLMHKAPAAFGLITTLKQRGYAKYKLTVWLTVFAASAPVAAIVTYVVCSLFAAKKGPQSGDQPWAGVVMLFSAGTFLYVAVAHTLVEAVAQAKSLRAKMAKGHGTLGLVDVAVLLAGMILPPLVAKDHDD